MDSIHHICEIEKSLLLIVFLMSDQNPPLACQLFCGNRSNFLLVDGSTA